MTAALIDLAARRAADLSARGLEHRLGWREHDLLRRAADQVDGERVDAGDELGAPRGIGLAGLREHHDPLGAARPVRHAEDRDATLADAGDIADRLPQPEG